MSQTPSWYSVLLEASRDRSLTLDIPAIDLVRETDAPDLSSWVRRNLVNTEPLTKEELLLLQHINKSKGRTRDTRKNDTDTNVPLDVEGLQDSIRALELSTSDFQLRSHTIQAQRNLMSNMDGLDEDNVLQCNPNLSKQQEAERQRLFFINQETQTDLLDRLKREHERLEKYIKVASSTLRAKLKADDRILDLLAATSSSHLIESPVAESESKGLLVALRQVLTSAFKAHLDHVYSREITSPISSSVIPMSSIDLQQAHGDLHSLYSEIEDVTSMLVDAEHGAMLTTMEQRLRSLAKESEVQHTLQIAKQLETLFQSADQISTRYQLLQAHRITCNEIHEICLRLKAKSGPDQSCHKEEESVPQDPDLLTLLRHLNLHQGMLTGTTYANEQGQIALTSLADENRKAVAQITERVWKSMATNRVHLRSFSGVLDDAPSEATQRNTGLDSQTTFLTARLEQMYGMADAGEAARRRIAMARSIASSNTTQI